MNICKNCDHKYEGNYCNLCGQPNDVQHFTILYFLKETFFSSLDIEGGFFHTIKLLAIKPASSIREYLKGRRLRLYVPGKFLLIFGAIATFITIKYQVVTMATDEDLPFFLQLFQNVGFDTMGFFRYAEEFTTLVNIFAIPVFSLFTWVFFQKKYNYAENLVLNTYITAMQLIALVISSPFIVLFPSMQSSTVAIYSIVILSYNIWVVLAFFGNYRWTSFLKMGAALICSFIGQFIINYLIYLVIGDYMKFLKF
jgi:hypothetical protein